MTFHGPIEDGEFGARPVGKLRRDIGDAFGWYSVCYGQRCEEYEGVKGGDMDEFGAEMVVPGLALWRAHKAHETYGDERKSYSYSFITPNSSGRSAPNVLEIAPRRSRIEPRGWGKRARTRTPRERTDWSFGAKNPTSFDEFYVAVYRPNEYGPHSDVARYVAKDGTTIVINEARKAWRSLRPENVPEKFRFDYPNKAVGVLRKAVMDDFNLSPDDFGSMQVDKRTYSKGYVVWAAGNEKSWHRTAQGAVQQAYRLQDQGLPDVHIYVANTGSRVRASSIVGDLGQTVLSSGAIGYEPSSFGEDDAIAAFEAEYAGR